jgi:hypothetical protein
MWRRSIRACATGTKRKARPGPLLGLSEGESIEWEFPDGSRRRLTLEKVLHQPERLGNSPLPRAP